MKIEILNGLNIIVDKKLELMLAIHAVCIKEYPEYEEELCFVEIPSIPYLEELYELIRDKLPQYLIDAILDFRDQSTAIVIALGLDDNYKFDYSRAFLNRIEETLGDVDLEEFVNEFKLFAEEIEWDSFFDRHKSFYQELLSQFCEFPDDLNMNDFEQFYGKKFLSYNYIPSILMNGGFGLDDKLGNLYYVRGIQWSDDENKFCYDKEYLLECLFHEFSHPIINLLIDNNLNLFTNLNEIFEDALNHNLPSAYSGRTNIFLYEYFVRANANILTRKYYPDAEIDDWLLQYGFPYLNDIIDYTLKNMVKYSNYEDFFINDMVSFMSNILNVVK